MWCIRGYKGEGEGECVVHKRVQGGGEGECTVHKRVQGGGRGGVCGA